MRGERQLTKKGETGKADNWPSGQKQWIKARKDDRERDKLSGPPRSHVSLSFLRIGSKAFVFTQSWGSLRPTLVDDLFLLISRLSRISKFCVSARLFLSLNVARIFGSYQFMSPSGQCRACFEMPDIVSSDLLHVVSLSCWPILVRKLTRVWPT